MITAIDDRAWLWHGKNTDLYPLLGDVDHVISDPPYGKEVHSDARVSRGKDGVVGVEVIPFGALEHEDAYRMASYCARHVKGGWALICSQPEQIYDWKQAAHCATEDARIDAPRASMKYNRANIWVKPDARPNFSGNGPGVGYETIQSYWCGGGMSKWNGGGRTGVFTHVKRHTGSHPTEKPLPLMRELITLFTNPGDVIFDPFMGSGSTGVAALELGRRFIGAEMNDEYFAIATRRITEASQVRGLVASVDKAKPVALFDEPAYATRTARKKETA